MTEESSFPRGGRGSKEKASKAPSKYAKNDPDLFRSEYEGSKSSKKRQKKQQIQQEKKEKKKAVIKKIKTNRRKENRLLQPNFNNVQILQSKNVAPNMLVLGCIKEIHDYELLVSLPGGLNGIVPITAISDAYSGLLQRLTEEATNVDSEEVSSLQGHFRVGQPVRCKVTDIPDGKAKSKAKVKLTINPREVNTMLVPTALRSGMVLSAAISSVEDHGYVLDLGVKGLNCFLKTKAVQSYVQDYREGQPLYVGTVLDVMVEMSDMTDLVSGESRTVKVVVEPRKVYRSQLQSSMKLPMLHLLPGMQVEAEVSNILETGVVVKFLRYKGTIHTTHLGQSTKKFTVGEKLRASILFLHPTTKAVSLTCLPHLVTPDLVPRKPFGDLDFGSIVDQAEVMRHEEKRGVLLKIGEKIVGLANKNQLSDTEVEDPKTSFKKQSTHRCRVIGFDYCEGIVFLSMKQSVLNKQFMSYGDIHPASTVECTVKSYHAAGIAVRITQHISGFIPSIHTADVPLKHPEKKLIQDKVIKCKVLSVDPGKQKVNLTCKKAFLKSKYEAVTSYEDFTPGKIVEGFIVQIQERGVLVAFYNNVTGWVPRKELSSADIEFPERVFFKGQVVRCRVIKIYPDNKPLLSFRIEGKAPFASQGVSTPDDFEIGKIVSCKIKEKTDRGLNVEIIGSGISAFLPKMHLSDHHDNAMLLWEMYHVGQVLEVMYLGKVNVITVSRKPSLLQAAREGSSVSDFDSLHVDMVLTGTVKAILDFGIFVDFTNKLTGLAPVRWLCTERNENHRELYYVGQSVVAKVMEINGEKQEFTVSLRESDCLNKNRNSGLDLLDQFLKEYDLVMEDLGKRKSKMKKLLSKYSCGDIVKVKVTAVSENGAVCETSDKVPGIIAKDHFKGVECEDGKLVKAIVLFVDPVAGHLEVTLDQSLVSRCKDSLHDNEELLKKELRCRIELVKEDFLLAAIEGETKGSLVYLPSKKFLNDVSPRKCYAVGERLNAVIQRVCGNHLLGAPSLHSMKLIDNLTKDDIVECLMDQTTAGGIRVKITSGLDGFIPRRCLSKKEYDCLSKLHKRQKFKCKILEINKAKKKVILKNEEPAHTIGVRDVKVTCGNIGKVERCWVTMKVETGMEVQLESSDDKAFLPIEHLSDVLGNCPWLWEMTEEGQELEVLHMHKVVREEHGESAAVHYVSHRSILLEAAKEGNLYTQLDKLLPGTALHCTVKTCDVRSVVVELLNKREVTVPQMFICDELKKTSNTRSPYQPGQSVVAMVMHPVEESRSPLLSLRVSDLHDGTTSNALDYLDHFLREYQRILAYLSRSQENDFAQYSIGQVVMAEVNQMTPEGLSVLVDGKVNGIVLQRHLEGLEDTVEAGQMMEGIVLYVDREAKCLELSMKTALVKQVKNFPNRKITVVPGQVIKCCQIQLVKDDFILVSLGGHLHGKLAFMLLKRHLNDPAVHSRKMFKGRVVVERVSGDTVLVCDEKEHKGKDCRPVCITGTQEINSPNATLKSDSVDQNRISGNKRNLSDVSGGTPDGDLNRLKVAFDQKGDRNIKKLKRKRLSESDSENLSISVVTPGYEKKNKRTSIDTDEVGPLRKVKKYDIEEQDSGMESEEEPSISKSLIMSPTSGVPARLSISADFSWNEEFSLPITINDDEEDSDTNSSDSPEIKTSQIKKKVKQKERLAKAKLEETKLYKGELGPVSVESAEKFNKLVMQSPNDSEIWIRYMKFHLQSAETNQARAIAERALTTISFREEQEKLRVWVAYLDLENTHGTPEQLDAVLRRALQQNEPIKVYNQLADVYVKSGKIEDAEQCYGTMVRRFSQVKDVWARFGIFHFKHGNPEAGRKLLQRSLRSLEQRDHVETIAKFAQLEFKFGEPERGKTMFENILSNYQKRTDLWSVYIDMLMKVGEEQTVRTLFERVIQLPLGAKKMKPLFKKYLDFEERFGSDDTVAAVKQKALDYVESKGTST